MKRVMATLLGLLIAAGAMAQLADGDQHWNLRAEGSQNGRAKADNVNAAIASYQKAVATDPNDLEARWKLLRTLRFKGAYVAASNEEKKQIYAQAKQAGEETLTVLDKRLAAKGISSVSKATEQQVADAAKTIPGASEIFLWDAINWGEWALAYGKFAAAREGAADRIRRAGQPLAKGAHRASPGSSNRPMTATIRSQSAASRTTCLRPDRVKL